MQKIISDIWIGSEIYGPIISGTFETDDNTDVIVTFEDGSKFVATFFTYENIESLRKKNQDTGECLNGKYFWASDLILVERINRAEITEVINHLLREGEFGSVFLRI